MRVIRTLTFCVVRAPSTGSRHSGVSLLRRIQTPAFCGPCATLGENRRGALA